MSYWKKLAVFAIFFMVCGCSQQVSKHDSKVEASNVLAQMPEVPSDLDEVESDPGEVEPDTHEPTVNSVQSHQMIPLTADQMAILDKIQWDLPPETLNAMKKQHEGKHFLYSDEKHPELFYDAIHQLGGTYIGVGTDQGYLFAGWQRPELAFFIDYDPWVVVLHHIYMAFWVECTDSACLLDYFSQAKKAHRLLATDEVRAKFAKVGMKDIRLIHRVYRMSFKKVARALERLQKRPYPTFMNDPEMFQSIKNLIEAGRVRSFQANLLGDIAFKSMAEALNALNVSVTTLYLSNAEQYWGYTAQFKQNMLNLPVNEKSLVMRTSATYPHNKDYRYSIQPMHVFRAWLNHPSGTGVSHITNRIPVEHPDHFPFVMDERLPDSQ